MIVTVGIIGSLLIVDLFLRMLGNYLTFLTVAWNYSTACLPKSELQHTRIKKKYFFPYPKYERIMKSLSFIHSNTYIFLRHTSCACPIRDTPQQKQALPLPQHDCNHARESTVRHLVDRRQIRCVGAAQYV
jgi:hypothetical protein